MIDVETQFGSTWCVRAAFHYIEGAGEPWEMCVDDVWVGALLLTVVRMCDAPLDLRFLWEGVDITHDATLHFVVVCDAYSY